MPFALLNIRPWGVSTIELGSVQPTSDVISCEAEKPPRAVLPFSTGPSPLNAWMVPRLNAYTMSSITYSAVMSPPSGSTSCASSGATSSPKPVAIRWLKRTTLPAPASVKNRRFFPSATSEPRADGSFDRMPPVV